MKIQYQKWLDRFNQLINAFDQGLIKENEFLMYQLFLIEFGQFNANFTHKELDKLHYPNSPFAVMHRHTYLRMLDTWAMQIMRKHYQEEFNTKNYPFWIDSNLFWNELSRYCKIIKNVNEIIDLNNGPYWVELDSEEDQKKIAQQIKIKLGYLVSNKQQLPTDIIDLMIEGKFLADKQVTKIFDDYFKKELNDEINKDILKIGSELRKEAKSMEDKFYKKLFGFINRCKITPPKKFNKPDELKNYLNDVNPNYLEELTENIIDNLSKIITVNKGVRERVIQKWNREHVAKYFNAIYFFRKINYHSINAILFVDHTKSAEEENWLPKNIINSLGYRIDPVRIVRLVLTQFFPNLFFDVEETKLFWNEFRQTSMVKELDQNKKRELDLLINETLKIKSNSKKTPINEIFISDISKELNAINLIKKNSNNDGFKLYSNATSEILQNILDLFKTNTELQSILLPELKTTLIEFIEAYKNNDFPKALRCVQNLSDMLLLSLEKKPFNLTLFDTVKKHYFKNQSIQTVLITPYAMRAFVRVFQILDTKSFANPVSIYVTNQSYFEWLLNLEQLKINGAKLTLARDAEEINPDADVIFIEVHPNNAVIFKQYAFNLQALLDLFNNHKLKPRTLVIDGTLNSLDDSALNEFLKKAKPFIVNGQLNIIILQSLTKFSQLGLDKRSGGLITLFNNNKDQWNNVNKKAHALSIAESIDLNTSNFFTFFLTYPYMTKNYLALVNQNVRFVYNKIVEQLSKLELEDRSRFNITLSSDEGSCYIALNLKGMLFAFANDNGFSISTKDVEIFSKDVLNYLVKPLCDFLELPLTERMSIGFPLSSINPMMASIRFTIGLESQEQLELYADVIAYTSFVINRQYPGTLFFEKDDNQSFKLRQNFLNEKVLTFKAMTMGQNQSYRIEFEATGNENSYQLSQNTQPQQLKRCLVMENGIAKLIREYPEENNSINSLVYYENQIEVSFYDMGDKSLNTFSNRDKRLFLSCFTQFFPKDQTHHQNVNMVFTNTIPMNSPEKKVTLTSMEILGKWNIKSLYGPFQMNESEIYFELYRKNIVLKIKNKSYDEKFISVKQGKVTMPLTVLTLEQKLHLIEEGGYEVNRSNDGNTIQYKPKKNTMKLSLIKDNFIIETDFICFDALGLTVYKRYIDNNITCIEMDYWIEKDPALARFLTLMIAICMKEHETTIFNAKTASFTTFLFKMAYDTIDNVVNYATNRVLEKKQELEMLQKSYKRSTKSRQYSFFQENDRNITWPSGYSGVTYVSDGDLIDEGKKLLCLKK